MQSPTIEKPRKTEQARRREASRDYGAKPLRDDKGWQRHDKRAAWQ